MKERIHGHRKKHGDEQQGAQREGRTSDKRRRKKKKRKTRQRRPMPDPECVPVSVVDKFLHDAAHNAA